VRNIEHVIVHHTASPSDWTLERISDAHQERGFAEHSGTHCGYHYVIESDATVRLGRSIDVVGAHCKGFNAKSIGVCVVGSFEGDDEPTEEQWATLVTLCADLLRQFPDAGVVGHKEMKPTLCPGFDPSILRSDVFAKLEC
jgi:N-acetylmuramoyl-L-alanine amidase